MGDIVQNRIVHVPLKQIEKPRSGWCDVKVEHWWLYHPQEDSVLFYKSFGRDPHAQCHQNKTLALRIFKGLWEPYGFELLLVPVAFVPLAIRGSDNDFYYNLAPLLKG